MKNFSPTRPTISVNATTDSQVVSLGDHACDLLVTNEGAVKVFLTFGVSSSVVADEGGTWITRDSQQVLGVPMGFGYAAVRTESDEAVVGLQVGRGS